MLLWRNPTQYMCGCGFGNHIEPSYWTLKWFVIFLPLIVTFHLFRSLWGHCGQLSKKCVGPGATRESPYGHLGPLWPQTHLIPCGKANRSHTGKFGTPQCTGIHWLMITNFQNTVGQPGGSKNRSFSVFLFLNFVWKRFCFRKKLITSPFPYLYNEADQITFD